MSRQDANRYGVTHAFEIDTAKTLGKFEIQLQQHTKEIGTINENFSAMSLSFAKQEADIHDISESIKALKDPKISIKSLLKIAVAVLGSSTVSMMLWDSIRAWLHLP